MKFRGAALILLLVLGLSIPLLRKLGHRPLPAIIPLPESLQTRAGFFNLGPGTRIQAASEGRPTAELLAGQLRKSTGFPFPVADPSSEREGDIILTTAGASAALGSEGYELEVAPEAVRIHAQTSAGLFYGAQTLLQLLPPEIFRDQLVSGRNWRIGCVQIKDRPRFAWRGLMLDVSRHFFTVPELKRLLDSMALHKLNVFQWHLTDDQGWRLEIKAYPRLTQVGAWRERIGFGLDPKCSTTYGPDGRYGGFYTQAEVREIVAYAAARHITVVPELEFPGHSNAALAAYPELSCTGGPYSTDSRNSAASGVYCAGNDETFTFAQAVLNEVMDLFPGKYVHVGGDEVTWLNWRDCPKCQARLHAEGLKDETQLQGYFLRRLNEVLTARGRTLIGWSETRAAGLAPGAVLMDWKGGGREAAIAAHDVVMAPSAFCYFDYYQSPDRAAEPRATAAYLPLEKVYSLEPVPSGLTAAQEARVLGTQGNLWTEYIGSTKQLEYMAFPRLSALAEVAWSPKNSRDWADFSRRLKATCQRLRALGIHYREPDAL